MRRILLIVLCACALAGCREYRVSDDPSLQLSFSCDTLRFDTVFTEQGSATAQVMVYNRNKNALVIDRVWLDNGGTFIANVDGEADLARLTKLQINGGDSLFVFIRVNIDPNSSDAPFIVSDRLNFHLASGSTQSLEMEAYGQNVIRIGSKGCGRTDKSLLTFFSERPYIVYDTLVVSGNLIFQAGATVYMHRDACIIALGNVSAKGTRDKPVLIRGDRLDRLFENVPYLYAGGGWNGIYLQAEKKQNWQFDYVDILSGNIGLYCLSTCTGALPKLRMNGCRIHNHTLYGLVLLNTDAQVSNTEISNCASYCLYCSGGTHTFAHTTVASYFGSTDIRIQSVAKEATAAVYIDNLSKTGPATVDTFVNCIITGYQANQLVLATPFDQYYTGAFIGNYLKTDTLRIPHAHGNTYWTADEQKNVFRNTYYKYKEYVYYDFHLDSLSAAIGIGDSIAALPYPTDRDGVSRALLKPDAGCYQYNNCEL